MLPAPVVVSGQAVTATAMAAEITITSPAPRAAGSGERPTTAPVQQELTTTDGATVLAATTAVTGVQEVTALNALHVHQVIIDI